MEILEYLSRFVRNEYQRDNFDAFLKKVKFSYNVPSIHIAGTNGKGTTANYIAGVYKASGKKVGLFTSPYLIKVNEMITINGETITNDDFFHICNEYEKLFDKYSLSPFEIETFVALTYFALQNCDIAVIECGMGGELDATNIFTPILSIITSIAIEHTEFLGNSLLQITQHKCGIIKEKIPVILGELDEETTTYISQYAKDLKAPVFKIVDASFVSLTDEGYKFSYLSYKDILIKSFAIYSVIDARIAIEALNTLKNKFDFSEENLKEGLMSINMPGRMYIACKSPLIVIDGSHNPQGTYFLKKSFDMFETKGNLHVVFSCFRDKNLTNMLSNIGELTNDITFTTFNHPRARTEDEFFIFLTDYKFEEDAIGLIKKLIVTYPDDTILITGSLGFAGYIEHMFKKGIFDEELRAIKK